MDTIWTILSGGRPVAAFNIEDAADAEDARQQAEAFIGDSDLQEDLTTWEDDEGVPLWDGQAEISIRVALPEEESVFKEVYAEAVEEDDTIEDDGFLVFLVPVNDPEEEEEEEDDDDDDED